MSYVIDLNPDDTLTNLFSVPAPDISLHVQTIRQVGALCFSCLIRTDFRISSAQVNLCGNCLDNSAKQMLRDAVKDRADFILLLE